MKNITQAPKQKHDKRSDHQLRIGRRPFDQVVKTTILDNVRMIGDDYLDQFLSIFQKRNGVRNFDLGDVDVALNSVFSRFSIAIKHVIMFQVYASLKIEPQELLKSLEWTIQEIRSTCW